MSFGPQSKNGDSQETRTVTSYLYSPVGGCASYASSQNNMSVCQEVTVTSAITVSPSSKQSCDLLKRHFPVAKLDLLLAASELGKRAGGMLQLKSRGESAEIALEGSGDDTWTGPNGGKKIQLGENILWWCMIGRRRRFRFSCSSYH